MGRSPFAWGGPNFRLPLSRRDYLCGKALDFVQPLAQKGPQFIGLKRCAIRRRSGKQSDRFVGLRIQIPHRLVEMIVAGNRRSNHCGDSVEAHRAPRQVVAINDPKNIFRGRARGGLNGAFSFHWMTMPNRTADEHGFSPINHS